MKAQSGKKHQDLDLLQGAWTVTALEVDGQSMSADMLEEARIVIQGARFTSNGMGAEYGGTVELDASAKPRRIDMKFDSGPEKGNTNRGIYELDGDTWKLCLNTLGGQRPAKFGSAPGSGIAVETLTRGAAPAKTKARASKKAAPAGAPSGAPAAGFEGEWQMVSGVMDGNPMEQSTVQWVRRVTQGNQTTVYAGPQVMMKFGFTTDPAASPKAIDYVNTAGLNKGKTQYGIYEFEGDLLRVCMAAPGAARPTKFQSARGEGATLTEWKRGK